MTLETVFSTLEHTVRMLRTTGENRGFRRTDLAQKRDRLKQAIAIVFEDSLTERGGGGTSRQTPKVCANHEAVVTTSLRRQDDIISFNYDCVLDYDFVCADGCCCGNNLRMWESDWISTVHHLRSP